MSKSFLESLWLLTPFERRYTQEGTERATAGVRQAFFRARLNSAGTESEKVPPGEREGGNPDPVPASAHPALAPCYSRVLPSVLIRA